MTLLQAFYACYRRPEPDTAGGKTTRTAQLYALADQAESWLQTALGEGRHCIIQAATRFVVDSHALLNRWMDRHPKDLAEPTPMQRCHALDEQAIMQMFEEREDILAEFTRIREALEPKAA